MKNSIIDEVRAARAALAAEHGYDIQRITTWARQQTEILKAAAKRPIVGQAPEATESAPHSPAVRKRRVRSARVSS